MFLSIKLSPIAFSKKITLRPSIDIPLEEIWLKFLNSFPKEIPLLKIILITLEECLNS